MIKCGSKIFNNLKYLQNIEEPKKQRLKQILCKNSINKIIRALRLYHERQNKYRTTTDMSNINTNINITTNNINNNPNQNLNINIYNHDKNSEDNVEENLNITKSLEENNDLQNNTNDLEPYNSINPEQYVTQHSSSTTSFTHTKKYIGLRDSKGFKTKFGLEQRGDGTIFKGLFNNDKLEGWGIKKNNNGIHQGEFEEGRTCGFGIYTQKSNGTTCYGTWMDDMLFGIGYEIWHNDNNRYEGEYNNGVKDGIGTYSEKGFIMYQGEWSNNNIEGFGIYTYLDGRKYTGQWKANKMDGYGEFYMKEGKIYFGFYKNDKRDGFGIHYFPKNKFYVGFWKEGKQHGNGKVIHKKSVNYCLFNSGKKIKTFHNEEEFLKNIGYKEKQYEKYFKWDIHQLKEYLYLEGNNKDEDNPKDNDTEKKHQENKENIEE